ncbi:MAG: hypothetical protein J6V22_03570 [Clostridia bacterium]|nr:hypothetical protein [Clostridia bacterium]
MEEILKQKHFSKQNKIVAVSFGSLPLCFAKIFWVGVLLLVFYSNSVGFSKAKRMDAPKTTYVCAFFAPNP